VKNYSTIFGQYTYLFCKASINDYIDTLIFSADQSVDPSAHPALTHSPCSHQLTPALPYPTRLSPTLLSPTHPCFQPPRLSPTQPGSHPPCSRLPTPALCVLSCLHSSVICVGWFFQPSSPAKSEDTKESDRGTPAVQNNEVSEARSATFSILWREAVAYR